jgi:hypothetical protein
MAWSRAEDEVRTFIERTQIPFLRSPMGKGVMPGVTGPGVTVTVYRGSYGDSLPEFSQQARLLLHVALGSRLWAGSARCKGAAEPPLERCDPFRRPKRSPDRVRPLDPSRRRLVLIVPV